MSHPTRSHARLAPSAAHRWMACPGSVRLSKDIPNRSSIFADEGTAAHMLAEHCLESGQDAAQHAGRYVCIGGGHIFGDEPGDKRFLVDEEMVEGVQLYLDYIREHFDRCDHYEIEQRVDLTHLHAEFFGTGDASGYEEVTETLHAFDFKYGKRHVVDPKENPQLLSYASGFVRNSFKADRPVRRVVLHVIQPRAPHQDGPIRKWSATLTELRDFERYAHEAAKATEQEGAALVPGDHCDFCPAAAICPKRREVVMSQAMVEFAADTAEYKLPDYKAMTAEDLGRLVPAAKALAKWCEQVADYAYAEAVDGRVPIGQKLVAKRAVRKWADEDKIASVLKTIFDLDDNEVFTRKLISPAGAEKLLGKKEVARLARYQTKVSSGTTLAPLDDPREPVRADPAVEFGGG